MSSRSGSDRTVVLGAAGTGASFAIATRLRATWGEDIRIVGMDTNPPELVTTSLLCDRFHQITRADDPSFPRVLEDVLAAEAPATYLPILNEEIARSAGLVEKWREKDVDVVAPDPSTAELARDKLLLASWLEDAGIPSPKTFLPADRRGSGPWFMKPRNGFGSHNVCKVDSTFVESARPDELEGVIFQELCTHPEVTVDSFFDTTIGWGRALCRERLETKAGVCTKAKLFEDEQLTQMAARLAGAIAQRGTICFQVMRAGKDWVLTDLNLRPGAGTAMTCAAGFDVLSAFLACRWNLPFEGFFPPTPLDRPMIVTRQYAEFVMHA